MLDDDDIGELLDFAPDGGRAALVIFIAVLIVVACIVYANHETCEKQICDNNKHAQLADHQCVCPQ